MQERIEGSAARSSRWRRFRTAAPRVLRRILGAPDYEAYLEHCRTAGHPVELDERRFCDEFFNAKGRTPRCC
jgi:uncharacterized short protein YbdD (DUF466 family)